MYKNMYESIICNAIIIIIFQSSSDVSVVESEVVQELKNTNLVSEHIANLAALSLNNNNQTNMVKNKINQYD